MEDIKEKKFVKVERLDPKTGKMVEDDTFIRESLAKLDPEKAKQEKLKALVQAKKDDADLNQKIKAEENRKAKPKIVKGKIKDKLTSLKVVNGKKVILEKHRRQEFIIVEDTPKGPKVHRFIGDKLGIL